VKDRQSYQDASPIKNKWHWLVCSKCELQVPSVVRNTESQKETFHKTTLLAHHGPLPYMRISHFEMLPTYRMQPETVLKFVEALEMPSTCSNSNCRRLKLRE